MKYLDVVITIVFLSYLAGMTTLLGLTAFGVIR